MQASICAHLVRGKVQASFCAELVRDIVMVAICEWLVRGIVQVKASAWAQLFREIVQASISPFITKHYNIGAKKRAYPTH